MPLSGKSFVSVAFCGRLRLMYKTSASSSKTQRFFIVTGEPREMRRKEKGRDRARMKKSVIVSGSPLRGNLHVLIIPLDRSAVIVLVYAVFVVEYVMPIGASP